MKDLWQKLRIYGVGRFASYVLSELRLFVFRWVRGSYSQMGEDLVIDKLVGWKERGFYVDVGANDPVRFNNTYRFYKRGWRGINLEPDLGRFEEIKKARLRDTNLNIGVGGKAGLMTLYRFMPDTLSTFSEKEAKEYQREGYILREKRKVRVEGMATIFAKHVGKRQIDFMSIDTEGFDEEVLASNDWKKYRPRIICVESENVGRILKNAGYELVLDNGLNRIYQNKGKRKK